MEKILNFKLWIEKSIFFQEIVNKETILKNKN